MLWVSIVSGLVLLGGLVAWVVYVRRSAARDAEAHAKGKKSPHHLSTFGEPDDR